MAELSAYEKQIQEIRRAAGEPVEFQNVTPRKKRPSIAKQIKRTKSKADSRIRRLNKAVTGISGKIPTGQQLLDSINTPREIPELTDAARFSTEDRYLNRLKLNADAAENARGIFPEGYSSGGYDLAPSSMFNSNNNNNNVNNNIGVDTSLGGASPLADPTSIESLLAYGNDSINGFNSNNSFGGFRPQETGSFDDIFNINNSTDFGADFSNYFGDSTDIGAVLPDDRGMWEKGWDWTTGIGVKNDAGGDVGMFGGVFDDVSLQDVGSILSGGAGAYQAYLGGKEVDLMEDQFKYNKQVFNRNLANQATLINSELEDRQRGRISAAGGESSKYQSLGSYMDQNSVSGAAIG